MEGDQIGQARPAFHEATVAVPNPLVVLHIPCHGTQDDLVCDLP